LAPALETVVAAAGLTGGAVIAVEAVAGAVASWGISGAVEDVFQFLGGVLSSGNIELPGTNLGNEFSIDPESLSSGASDLTLTTDASGQCYGALWQSPELEGGPASLDISGFGNGTPRSILGHGPAFHSIITRSRRR
jgi:hypothetical protein